MRQISGHIVPRSGWSTRKMSLTAATSALAVHDVIERAAERAPNRLQRTFGREAERKEVRAVPVAREAEDLARQVLIEHVGV
ncbi:MAG: hypothetical protein ACRD0U_06565, partial [Acidimicrobiales bacterium]